MPGRPMLERLERDVRERGGEEWVFDQIASGVRIGKIAESFGVSRRMLYMWRDHKPHDVVRKPAWEEALRLSAESHAERGMEDLEKLDEGNKVPLASEVQLGSVRSKYRQWLASRFDPERFGDKGIELNFNVGQLHLEAVKRIRAESESGRIQEAEILAIEGGDDDAPGHLPNPGHVDSGDLESAGGVIEGRTPSAPDAPDEPSATSGALPDDLADLL